MKWGQVAGPYMDKRLARRALLLFLTLWTASCTTLTVGSSSEEKEKAVTLRAQARWEAIIARDFDAAYGYLSPASRKTVTRDRFKTVSSRLAYRAVKVRRVTCDTSVCKVAIDLTYDAPMMKGVQTPLQEAWIIDHGQAWYVWGA